MFKLPPHTATHVATSIYQAELLSKLLLTGTYFRKRAVAMVSYSPTSTLYPQVLYAIVFPPGLNGLQVDQVDRENNKRTLSYIPSRLYYTRPRCGLTIHATPTQLLHEWPTRNIWVRTRSDLGTVFRP